MAEPDEGRRDGGGPGGETSPAAGNARWRRLYLLVLGVLAAEIAGLWLLSLAFR